MVTCRPFGKERIKSQSHTAILNDLVAITDTEQDTGDSEAIQGEKVKDMNSSVVPPMSAQPSKGIENFC